MYDIHPIYLSAFLVLLIVLNLYWTFVIISRIHCSIKYKRGAARCIVDEESAYINSQICYHYETEIWKYLYLLLINFAEVFTATAYYISGMNRDYGFDVHQYNSTLQSYRNQCSTSLDTSVLNLIINLPIIIPLPDVFVAIGNIGQLLVTALSVCLLNYLIVRMKNISYSQNRFNPSTYLKITTILSLTIFFTSCIRYTSMVSTLLFVISNTIYCWVLFRSCNQFKTALIQIALERLAQHGSNRDEMKQYKYFKHTFNILWCGFVFTLAGACMSQLNTCLVNAIYYGKCFFPFSFFPALTLATESVGVTATIVKCFRYTLITSTSILVIGLCLFFFLLLFSTVNIWIQQISKCFKKQLKIKYTTLPSLVEPLLKK